MAQFSLGQKVYIVESGITVREAEVFNICGDMLTLRFSNGGGIRLNKKRVFATLEEAKQKLNPEIEQKNKESAGHSFMDAIRA